LIRILSVEDILVYMRTGSKVFYPELSYTLTGIFFNVHNQLGRFEKEKRYGNIIEEELKRAKVAFVREYKLPTGDYVDFLIEDKIIIELKAKNIILKTDFYQVHRYLRSANLKLGMIVNFRNRYLKPIRILNSDAP
jgi:GxxExxY protein